MKCPYCGYQESKVVDSRHSEDGQSIRRRRECLSCQKRFTTYETVECLPIVVIKRDGARQAFDRNKILNGMLRACEKRPVALAKLEAATDAIEQIMRSPRRRSVSLLWSASSLSTRSPTCALPRSTGSSRTSTASCASSISCWRKNKHTRFSGMFVGGDAHIDP